MSLLDIIDCGAVNWIEFSYHDRFYDIAVLKICTIVSWLNCYTPKSNHLKLLKLKLFICFWIRSVLAL